MSNPTKMPQFLRECLDEPGMAEEVEFGMGVASGLPALEPGPAVIGRLLQRVDSGAGRYAPFFDQLTQLFDLDEAALESELTRAADAKLWKASGLPGVRLFAVAAGERLQSAQTLLVRFAAGKSFPAHRHRAPERTLILEGGYRDQTNAVFNAGDFDDRGTDVVHSFRVLPDRPCIAASVHWGFDFTFFPLRLFARVLGH